MGRGELERRARRRVPQADADEPHAASLTVGCKGHREDGKILLHTRGEARCAGVKERWALKGTGAESRAPKAPGACARLCAIAVAICALVVFGMGIGSDAVPLGHRAWADAETSEAGVSWDEGETEPSGRASAIDETHESPSEAAPLDSLRDSAVGGREIGEAQSRADSWIAGESGDSVGQGDAGYALVLGGESADAAGDSPGGTSDVNRASGAAQRVFRALQVNRADPLGSLAPDKEVAEFAYIGSLDQDAMEFKTRYPNDIKYLATSDTAASNWEGPVASIVARLSPSSEGSWGQVDYIGSESSPVLSLVWRNAGYSSQGRSLDVRLDVTELTLVRAGEKTKTWQSVMDYRGGRNGGFNFNAQGNSWVKSSEYDGEGTAGYRLSNDVQIRCTLRLCEAGTDELVDVPILMTWKDIDQPGYPGVSYYDGDSNPYKDYWHGKNGTVSDWNEQVLLGDGFDAAVYVDPGTYLNVTERLTKDTVGWAETSDVLGSSTWMRFAATRAENNERDRSAVKLAAMSTYLYGGKGTFIWRGYGCSTAMFDKMTAPPHVQPDVGLGKTPATQTVERGQCAAFDVSTQPSGSNAGGIVPYTYTGASSNAYRSIVFSDELDAAFDASKAVVAMYRTDTGKGADEADDTENWSISVAGQNVSAACKDTTKAGGQYRMHIEVPVREDANLDAYEARAITDARSVRVVPNAGKLTIVDDVFPTKEIETETVEVYVPSHSIEVVKVDAESGGPLAGAVFGLYDDAECKHAVGSAVADDRGKAFWTEFSEESGLRVYLIAGRTFYIRETNAPLGYQLDGAVRPVTIEGDCIRVEVRDSRMPVSWTPLAHKTLIGADGTARDLKEGQFSFELQEVDDRGDSLGQAVIASNGADGAVSFGPVEFVAAGVHRYRVSEVHPEEAEPGIQYDGEAYTVEVTVAPDSSNALAVTERVNRSDGESCDAVTFENRYRENRLPQTGSSSALIGIAAGMGVAAAGVLLHRMRQMR